MKPVLAEGWRSSQGVYFKLFNITRIISLSQHFLPIFCRNWYFVESQKRSLFALRRKWPLETRRDTEDMSDKVKAASEHNIDSTNKTEPEPLIRKSTINDFAGHRALCYCCRVTRGIKSDRSKHSLSWATFSFNEFIQIHTTNIGAMVCVVASLTRL